MEEPEKTHHGPFAVRHDMEIGLRMFAMNLLHRAVESPDDIVSKKGELRDDLDVAEVFLEHAVQIEFHEARFVSEEGEILEGVNCVDDFFQHFGGETEVRFRARGGL